MTTMQIVDTRIYHCGQMARALRREHKECLERAGANVHAELRSIYSASSLKRTLLIDGKIAMMGGIVEPMMAPFGFVWIAMTQEATRRPIALIKILRKELDEAMILKRELYTRVLGDDEAAKRLAIFMGFHVADEGTGRPAYSRASRRLLAQHIDTNPDVRCAMGKSYGINMGYHAEAEVT